MKSDVPKVMVRMSFDIEPEWNAPGFNERDRRCFEICQVDVVGTAFDNFSDFPSGDGAFECERRMRSAELLVMKCRCSVARGIPGVSIHPSESVAGVENGIIECGFVQLSEK